MSDKSSQAICLTTIEYVVYGSPILTTNCPGCGLRLAIKHDNFVNRVASVSLILGMSLLIGYNLGKHNRWISRLSNKLFGSRHNTRRDDNESDNISNCKLNLNYATLKEATTNDYNLIDFASNNFQSNPNGNDFYTVDGRPIEDIDDSKMSDHTCDSAIDICSSSLDCDYYDEQLLRLLDLSSNDYLSSGEFSNSGRESIKSDDDRKNFRSKTVDKIDQVLHQIDDIKKSIVEIDDEIFQVAGSTYAKFDPNSLILTNGEFDKEFEETFLVNNKSHCTDSECHSRKLSANSKLNYRRETMSTSPQITFNDNLIETKARSDIHIRRSSSDQSDLDSLQLEWDFELGYNDYCDSRPAADTVETDDSRSGDIYRSIPDREIPMTDEQKLKNMHNLLDEAKKLGLLNNIIDALNQTSTNSCYLRTATSSKSKVRTLPTPPASPLRLIEFEDEIDAIMNNKNS